MLYVFTIISIHNDQMNSKLMRLSKIYRVVSEYLFKYLFGIKVVEFQIYWQLLEFNFECIKWRGILGYSSICMVNELFPLKDKATPQMNKGK